MTAGVYIFLYQKYRLEIIRYYLFHLAATIVMVFFVALTFYAYLNMGLFSNMIKMLFAYTSSMLLFSAPVIYTIPVLFRAVAGKENTKRVKLFFAALSFFSMVNGLVIFSRGYINTFKSLMDVFLINPWLLALMWMGVLILYIVIIYSNILVFRAYKSIDDPVRKLAAKYLIVFCIVSTILVYFDFEAQRHQLLKQQYPVGIFLQPLNLLVFSIISLAVIQAARKIYVEKSQKIPHAFIVKYKITDREIEIIEMIIAGLSNREIASKLFLSPSTIRNHISNIFEKAKTPTRGKLLNLINNTIE